MKESIEQVIAHLTPAENRAYLMVVAALLTGDAKAEQIGRERLAQARRAARAHVVEMPAQSFESVGAS